MAANNRNTNFTIPPIAPPITPNRPGSRLNTMFPQTVFPSGRFFASPTFPQMSPMSSVQQVKAHNATTPTSRTPFMPSAQNSWKPSSMIGSGPNTSRPIFSNYASSAPFSQSGGDADKLGKAFKGLTSPTSYGTYGAGRPAVGGEGASYAKGMVRSWLPRAAWAQNNVG